MLKLSLLPYLREVIVPGLAPYLVAGADGFARRLAGARCRSLAGSWRDLLACRRFLCGRIDCGAELLGADERGKAKGSGVFQRGLGNVRAAGRQQHENSIAASRVSCCWSPGASALARRHLRSADQYRRRRPMAAAA